MNNNNDDNKIPENFWIDFFEKLGWFFLKIMIWVVIFLAIADWVASK